MENSGEIAALLRSRYPAAKVQTVSFDRRPDLTVFDQVCGCVGQCGWNLMVCEGLGRKGILLCTS